jgi:hypothetical protein
VIVDHGYGLQSLYGHLSSITVKEGQMVQRGQELGAPARPASPAAAISTSPCSSRGSPSPPSNGGTRTGSRTASPGSSGRRCHTSLETPCGPEIPARGRFISCDDEHSPVTTVCPRRRRSTSGDNVLLPAMTVCLPRRRKSSSDDDLPPAATIRRRRRKTVAAGGRLPSGENALPPGTALRRR